VVTLKAKLVASQVQVLELMLVEFAPVTHSVQIPEGLRYHLIGQEGQVLSVEFQVRPLLQAHSSELGTVELEPLTQETHLLSAS